MAMPGFLQVFGYYDEAEETWAIDPTVQQLISSLMTIGTFVGSLLVGPFSAKLGRRWGLWAASLINMVSTAIMIGTTHLGALYFARLILGKLDTNPLKSILICSRHLRRLVPDFRASLRERGRACSPAWNRVRCVPKPTVHWVHCWSIGGLRHSRHDEQASIPDSSRNILRCAHNTDHRSALLPRVTQMAFQPRTRGRGREGASSIAQREHC